MKLAKLIFVFIICEFQTLVISNEVLSIENTFKNVESKVDTIIEASSQMLPNHPDGEIEILKMFQEILPEIQNFDQDSFKIVEDIEKILLSIANQHRYDHFYSGVKSYFLKPWEKVKTAMIHIALHFKQLKQFVKNQVYIDEVIINDFIQSHESKEHLKVIQDSLAPKNISKGLLYKLFLATKYQVQFTLE